MQVRGRIGHNHLPSLLSRTSTLAPLSDGVDVACACGLSTISG
jgi:hypothetical protein